MIRTIAAWRKAPAHAVGPAGVTPPSSPAYVVESRDRRMLTAWDTIEHRTTTLATAEKLIAPYILLRYQRFMGLWQQTRAFRVQEL